MKLTRGLLAAAVASLLAAGSASTARAADTVVQVNVDAIIDGRSVSTVAGGTITPWTAAQGVDGDGNSDGFVTNAVETILATMGKTVGGKVGVALPDDGMFAADARHPAIQLHFSNAAPITSPQTHQVYINKTRGAQSFMFPVPAATYSKMFLLITASEGGAALTVTLTYSGATGPTVLKFMLPDYGIGGAPANSPTYFNLIAGMRKWGSNDNEGDTTTHTITGIELAPDPAGQLTSVMVEKTNGSHVVFWGATGIATSAVTTGTGGTGGSGGAGGTGGAGGAAGAGGAGGTTGAGGVTGAGGSATAGTGGTTSTGGAGGETAAGGTAGGEAGATGEAGAPGSAGTTATGGTAGAGGTSAPPAKGSSSGCSFAHEPSCGEGALFALVAMCGLAVRRRRASR